MFFSAKSVMKSAITVARDEQLDAAAATMDLRRISCLPVVDDDNKLLGILSKTDILHDRIVQLEVKGRKVEEAMSPAVVTCAIDTPLPEVARLMRDHQIHHLMVVDGEDSLLGVISALDLTEPMLKACAMLNRHQDQ